MTKEATPILSLAESRLQIPNPVHNCKLTSDAKCNIKCAGYSRGTSTDDMHNGSTQRNTAPSVLAISSSQCSTDLKW
ncbi:hypothetical protein RHGRI_032398 [Rhododendron griersonianum]|uniref:Uncharacterized protein n=1 Tax=Rhododendron griersonianum TaxID=479676 RepID=A0AAV6IE42_9ERIC|nr:hypothetical protein RHGRI_032391 [Rhododendron griersonianum]KAG5526085.1 hypothetical protein RHGRI_032398 [Rhododendron griersonianum]